MSDRDTIYITSMPTNPNIESMGIKDLREQYKVMEEDAINQYQELSKLRAKLHEMNLLSNTFSGNLWTLVDSFDEGNQEAVQDHLKMLSDQRKKFSGQKAKVH